jgi:iron complex transport system substrate-binding protein
VYPPQARQEKPKISGFTSNKLERILAVEPDLVIAFSDLQADIARDLIREGVEVHVFNHRDVAGIMRMVTTLGALVGKAEQASLIVGQLSARVAQARADAAALPRRPRVYFEEWHDPMISGIGWVSELIGIAGGDDVFADRAQAQGAKQRVVSAEEVLQRAPEIIIGSWCGKKFVPDHVRARPGWDALPALRDNELHEIKSADILAPGAVAINHGLAQLTQLFQDWAGHLPA